MPEFDGRYEVEWVYSVTISSRTLTHRHSFDVKVVGDPAPGTSFNDVEVTKRVGGGTELDTFCQAYCDVWSPLLGTGTALEEIILWKYDAEPSLSKIFISSLAVLPSTSFGGTPVAAQGAVFTFRQAGYRYPMRMYIMEGMQSGEERYPVSAFGGDNLAYAQFVISEDSVIQGRADVYPIAGIALNLGQNEKLRNLRFRTP